MINNELRDIKLNYQHGDIEILGNDLITINGKDVIRSAVIERLKTNFNDFVLNPNEGANLDSYIGKGISANLATLITNRIIDSLSYDGLVSRNSIRLIPILETNSIFIRIVINYNGNDIILNTNYSDGGLDIDE